MILKNYLTVPGTPPQQIHYRTAGADNSQPIILLHPSPLSSAFMQPLIELFSATHQVFAWDMPGYGQSDPLPEKVEGLAPYVKALDQFIDGLGVKKPIIYGSATGAQIAIEYAKAYAHKTQGLLLENAAWFTDEERDTILQHYFPDISPKQDGSHLQLVWEMVDQLYHFFPWFDTSEKARINSAEVPADIKQNTLMGYFTAGENYHLAYAAAFKNERPEQLLPVQVPTKILNWQSGILTQYVDRLKQANLPSNIEIIDVPVGLENRFSELKSLVKTLSQDPGN